MRQQKQQQQQIYRYLELLKKPRRTAKESDRLRYDGEDLMKLWAEALERVTKANDEQAAAFLLNAIHVFLEIYTIIVSCPAPRWADHEQEARRLTQALIQYYNLLATNRKLTAEQLRLFEKIDALLRARFFSINLSCLFAEDKEEIEAIGATVNIDFTRSHYVLTAGQATYGDGWYIDRRT